MILLLEKAYMMSDLGYDVWLANSRGTRYSRRHIRLDPTMPEFWDYSLVYAFLSKSGIEGHAA